VIKRVENSTLFLSAYFRDSFPSSGVVLKHANLFFYGDADQLKSNDFITHGNIPIDMVVIGKLPEAIL